jgi:hypothetical protein
MKKGYILAATALILLGVSTSACSSSASSSSSARVAKKAKPKYNIFKGKTFVTKTGVMTIKKVVNVKIHNNNLPDSDANYNAVIVTGTFTNKSKRAISPVDFFSNNLTLEQKLHNRIHTISTGSGVWDDGSFGKYANTIKASEDKVEPGKTMNFAIDFDLTKESGDKLASTYLLQPVLRQTAKPLEIKAVSDQINVASDVSYDNDDTDYESDDTDTNDDTDTDTDIDTDDDDTASDTDSDTDDDTSSQSSDNQTDSNQDNSSADTNNTDENEN